MIPVPLFSAICGERTILASNTSAISTTEIALKSVHKEHIIGTHYGNPPYLIPLVETIRTKEVFHETVERIFYFIPLIVMAQQKLYNEAVDLQMPEKNEPFQSAGRRLSAVDWRTLTQPLTDAKVLFEVNIQYKDAFMIA